MKRKWLILSDTHFHNWPEFSFIENGINSRLQLQLTAFKQALSDGRKAGCTGLIHLGDVFHTRGKVEPEVVNLVKHVLTEQSEAYKEILILTGNHDITSEGPVFNTAHILNAVSTKEAPINVMSRDTGLADMKSLMLPFSEEDFKERIKRFGLKSPINEYVVFMHQSILGAMYNKPITKGVDPAYLRKFKRVFCGHIHLPQDCAPNVHLVGAPYPMNFGDKYVGSYMIWDERTNAVSRHKLRHPSFMTVTDKRDVNKYDFIRFITSDRGHGVEPNPNLRISISVEKRKLVRVDAKTDRQLLMHYVKSTAQEDQDKKRLTDVGLALLKGVE